MSPSTHPSKPAPITSENLESVPADDKTSVDSVSHIDRSTVTANAGDVAHPQITAKEIGGRGGLEPTRFGDWEKNGRCIDF
jgi:hypothetical protein